MTMTQTQSSEAGRRGTNAPAAGAAPPDAVTVETRFGAITFTAADVLEFPQGLIGLPQVRRCGLAAIPDPRMGDFHLLQCLDELTLSFLVLPLVPGPTTIAPEDAFEACAALAVPPEDARFALIVTLRKTAEGLAVSANMRAPIVIDSKSRIARQHVLSNPDYPIRKPL